MEGGRKLECLPGFRSHADWEAQLRQGEVMDKYKFKTMGDVFADHAAVIESLGREIDRILAEDQPGFLREAAVEACKAQIRRVAGIDPTHFAAPKATTDEYVARLEQERIERFETLIDSLYIDRMSDSDFICFESRIDGSSAYLRLEGQPGLLMALECLMGDMAHIIKLWKEGR